MTADPTTDPNAYGSDLALFGALAKPHAGQFLDRVCHDIEGGQGIDQRGFQATDVADRAADRSQVKNRIAH